MLASTHNYFSASDAQLRSVIEANLDNSLILREVLEELRFRSTTLAKALKREIEKNLTLNPHRTTIKKIALPPLTESKKPHTLVCQQCKSHILVHVQTQTTKYQCPICQSNFEACFKDNVVEIVWRQSHRGHEDAEVYMTEALALEILGLNAACHLADIKEAWRKASQQYHPDKHQGLPMRLRQAAEYEIKRINAACHFLEQKHKEHSSIN